MNLRSHSKGPILSPAWEISHASRAEQSVSKLELYQWLREQAQPTLPGHHDWLAILGHRLSDWVNRLIIKHVVVGYEDELGFHYGSPPPQAAQWEFKD